MTVDKNLQNVAEDLEHTAVNAHEAQQDNQARNDRRKDSAKGKEGYQENMETYQ